MRDGTALLWAVCDCIVFGHQNPRQVVVRDGTAGSRDSYLVVV